MINLLAYPGVYQRNSMGNKRVMQVQKDTTSRQGFPSAHVLLQSSLANGKNLLEY